MSEMIYLTAEFRRRQEINLINDKLKDIVYRAELDDYGRMICVECEKDKEQIVTDVIKELSGVFIREMAYWKFIGAKPIIFPLIADIRMNTQKIRVAEISCMNDLISISKEDGVQCIYQRCKAIVC